jgi:hypothetical protein
MKLRFVSAFCILACLTFFACKNSGETTKNTPSVNATEKAPNQFYKHFRGKIGDYAVTMDVVKNIITENDGFQQLRGYYSYENYQEPISIIGSVEADGSWKLEEWRRDNSSAMFTGKFANGVFSGTWQDTVAKKNFAFTLTEDYSDGALKFDYQSFVDSVAMVKDKPKTPHAQFELNTLLPQNTEGGAGWLKNEILRTWSADTFGQVGKTPMPIEQAKAKRRDAFFKEYIEGNEELAQDTSEWSEMMFHWVMSYGMEVLDNRGDRVSLAYNNYWYTGGAHGNYGASLATYDLKQQKTLILDDVFKPNYKPTLNAALARSVRRYFGLAPKAPLTEALFENKIEANDNFAVTSKGILFNYDPYEIAAYAAGQIQLFVPFEELKNVLK